MIINAIRIGTNPPFAFITVTYPIGSTCWCENSTQTKRINATDTSGSFVFEIPFADTWTVSCTDGTQERAKTINIASKGDSKSVILRYPRIPSEYQEVEYLEFVNGSYIGTGVSPTNHFTVMKVNDVSYVDDKHWFGTTYGGNYSQRWYHFTTYVNLYWFGGHRSDNWNNDVPWSQGVHTLEYNKGNNYDVIIDGVLLGSGDYKYSPNELLIGRRGSVANASSFRLIEFSLYEKSNEDIKIIDYVPCYRKSDSVAGLYDLVNNVFKTNAGSGTFTVGGDVD